ncbi:MAG TPA: DUF2723 domain-containing protein, partial [Candidatus Eisenbacteria bacterium]|nr:DUF2723 domain-containing protein [Candidatus Eisenbacteria bacterium]
MSGAAAPPRTAAVAAGCAAGAVALLLYVLTASRYVASHDAAEFQTLARTGGIAHAGYPVLVMLLEGFGRLPFSTLPMRANLLSAISGAIVVGLAAWSGARLSGRGAAGLIGAIALALSITFWKESTHAGVHVFTLVLAVIAFHLAMRCAGRPSGRDAFLLGLTVGAGLLSHLTILALAPVLIVALVQAARARVLRVPHVAAAVLGLAIGLSAIAYLIAHDRPDQPMNYIQDTLRPDNAVELSGGHPPQGRIERAAWLLSARQFLGGYVFSPFSDSPRRLRDLVLDGLLNDLPLWGWPIALYGAWVLVRRRDPTAPWLGLWMAGALFCFLYAARPGMGPIFFLPGLWILSQLVAVALGAFAHRSRVAFALAGGLIVLTPLARL